MHLTILTSSPSFSAKDKLSGFKKLIKSVIGQKRGPSAVTESLIQGLTELNLPFTVNPPAHTINCGSESVIYVNESADALHWAINEKRDGKKFKLIAGPAIVNIPSENGGLICDSAIDAYLSPSEWNINWLTSLDSRMKRVLRLWPAGVQDYGKLHNQRGSILIYNKNPNPGLLDFIESYLRKNKISFRVIKYGNYSHNDFIDLMKQTRLSIFLSHSESQGLALHETWMAGIPTLVWNPGFVEYKNLLWKDSKLSAPHMSESCGKFFENINDFEYQFESMLSSLDLFKPREYSLERFTSKKSAENFLTIVKSL